MYKAQLMARMPMLSPTFHAREVRGRHQISGKASGPTLHNAITMKVVLKYHGNFAWATGWFGKSNRNSPQCLHLIASSWISSAQKGHFFMFVFRFGFTDVRATATVNQLKQTGKETDEPDSSCTGIRIRKSAIYPFSENTSFNTENPSVLALVQPQVVRDFSGDIPPVNPPEDLR